MTEDTFERNGSTANERAVAPRRRSVLQGIAALGLGSSTIGTAVAHQSDDSSERNGPSRVPVAIQLYTLRNLPDTTLELIRRVGSVDNNGGPGYDAVEFAGVGDASTSEINTTLEETGVDAASAHVGLENLEGSSFADTVQSYTGIGVDTFVIPSLSPSSLNTVEAVKDLAQRMNDIAVRLKDHDARVGFHNHDAVFQTLDDGRTPLKVFDENLDEDVVFEIDVGWVLTAGYDPAEIIRKYSDRTELIHMKDMKNGNFHELGEGAVDIQEVAQVARREANVDYLVYEHDQPQNPAGSVGTGAGVLSFVDGQPRRKCLKFADVGGHDYNGDLSG